jgi:hypothetical protein
MLKPLVDSAQKDRTDYGPQTGLQDTDVVSVKVVSDPGELAPLPLAGDVDVERVRAAVTIALDAALPSMIDKITEQVLVALGH